MATRTTGVRQRPPGRLERSVPGYDFPGPRSSGGGRLHSYLSHKVGVKTPSFDRTVDNTESLRSDTNRRNHRDGRNASARPSRRLARDPGTIPLHGDPGSGALDLPQVVGRQLDRCRPKVLFQPVPLRRTRDGDDPRLLAERPGQRDRGGRHLLPLGDLAEQFNQGLVRSPILGVKRGMVLRKSVRSSLVFSSILPARKPLPTDKTKN